MIKFMFLTMTTLIASNVFACSGPNQATDWNHEELVDRTNTVVLAELVEGQKRKFRVLEILKGDPEPEFVWARFRPKGSHKSIDFNGHTDDRFWNETDLITVRTTEFRGGMCHAQFTFVENEQYLVFVESVGHFHSAEIIKSKSDKWYSFVRARIAHNKKMKKDAAK